MSVPYGRLRARPHGNTTAAGDVVPLVHIRVEHPVTWPSDAGWQAWWRAAVDAELERSTVEPDGVVVHPDDEVDREAEHVRLVRGEHLRDGALYAVVAPQAPTITATAAIAGPRGERVLALNGRRTNRRGSVAFDVDGLDVLRRVSTTSGLPTLRWRASFEPDRRRLLDADVRLRWLRGRVEARVAPSRDGIGERLIVVVRVSGRGPWRPVVGLVLGLVPASRVRASVEEVVAGAAERMRLFDTDPELQTLTSRDEQHLDEGSALIQARALTVFESLEGRLFARGSRRSWDRAYAALPAPDWPPMPDGVHETWQWREEMALLRMLRARASRRREVVLGLAAWVREQHRAHVAAIAAAPSPHVHQPAEPITEEMANLDWLASPWAVYRFGRRQAREARRRGPGGVLP